jgi:DNA mismatch endonuclease, patch repair protein
MDVLTPEQRRLNMSRIRGKDTKPELVLRKALHSAGLRYRLQLGTVPGRPDLSLPKHKTLIFVHGCFWHGHNCPLFKAPRTNSDFWRQKIATNRLRDVRVQAELVSSGWRVLTVWECAIKGPGRLALGELIERCQAFIFGDAISAEICGFE